MATKTCTVSFFQLLIAPDEVRAAEVDWTAKIDNLARTSDCGHPGVHKCKYGGEEIDGVVSIASTSVSVAVGRALTPRQRNTVTAARSALPVDPGHEPVEETFFATFPRNVIGIVRSSQSSPSHAAIAAWLTKTLPPPQVNGGEKWVAKAIVDPDQYRAIADAETVSSVDFSVKPENIPGEEGLIHALINGAFGFSDGIFVEVRLRARRGKPGERARDDIRDVADELVQLHESGVPLEAAKVGIKRVGETVTEVIDLLNHRITTREDIELLDDASLDEDAVVAHIRSAYVTLQEQIAGAIGTDNG
ncbi:DUF6731 family protein [Gordonia alkanivorans]|uniref:DUF6731 family protein n=1 Tax=Gordonia alkanivorans TaxID=84096 RepID=UPI0024B7FE83|nr:DUF6731 family protein [Gordonia alkanivorans]MDJ0006466.1 hypothetical protein [Gordonia alkanivorans]MDJ0492094.1 hypothetical protein [Gordonia alkanivorans]